MAARTPLVLVGGETQQLQAGDTLSGGGGGTPGGSSGQVQYNNAGAFGGSAALATAGGALNCAIDPGAFNAGSYAALVVGATTGATAANGGLYAFGRYNRVNKPFTGLSGYDDGSHRDLYFGGTAWGVPDATRIFFFTAPAYSETNDTGVMHLSIDMTGGISVNPTGYSETDAGTSMHVRSLDDARSALTCAARSGTQAAPLLTFQAYSSTATLHEVGGLDGGYTSNVEASYKGWAGLFARASDGARRFGVTVGSDGTQALIGAFGAAAVAKPSGDVAAGLAALGWISSPTYSASGLTGALTTPVIAAAAAPAAAQGKLNFDSTRNALTVGAGASATPANVPMTGAVSVSTSPLTVNANVTTAQNLMSYAVPAGLLNVAGKALRLVAAGVLSVNTTATVTIAVKLGTVTLLTWTSASITGGAGTANSPWNFDAVLATAATGATGTVECHGAWNLKPTTGAGAVTSYIDIGTGPSAALDLAAAQTLQVIVTFSANGTGANANSCTERLLHCELSN